MNVIFFIRLLYKHLLILVAMPLLMVIVVFVLTQDQPKKYISHTKIYTGIATGSSIVSLEESKFDLFGTRTAFDNLINLIKSKTTIEEVGLRLFTIHMLLDKPQPDVILETYRKKLVSIVPEEVKNLVVKNDFEKTYQNFRAYKEEHHANFIHELINLNHRHYSAKKILGKMRVSRIQSSDMIEIVFESDDPGICATTLQLLNQVFVKRYSEVKVNQSDAVVKYFEKQITSANRNLDKAEKELVEFNKKNNIINYYEQTKHIASEKEHFDLIYTKIKMDHVAAESALRILENKMSESEKRRLNSDEMLSLRTNLSEVNYQIWMKTNQAQLYGDLDAEENENLKLLREKAAQLEKELRNKVNIQYNLDNSIEGFSGNTVLESWLQKMIEYEAAKAQLNVGKEINQDFRDLFKKYAPLGATMKRLERKIDVAERKYLSLLNSLNVAKLKQQNIELNSNLKIISPPFFPIMAEPSKRKFVLMIAFIIGWLVPAFIILVLEFLDKSIKTARRAEEQIGLKVASVFPKDLSTKDKLNHAFVISRSIEIILRKLILFSTKEQSNRKPYKFIFYSNQQGEGKTYISNLLAKKSKEFGYQTLLLTHNKIEKSEESTHLHYEIGSGFNRAQTIADLLGSNKKIEEENFDYIFIELPDVINHPYPIRLFEQADNSFLVVRANRAWSEADVNALKDIRSVAGTKKLKIILNGVEMTEMETVLGDLPKKRSFFRRLIKNVLRLRFFTHTRIL